MTETNPQSLFEVLGEEAGIRRLVDDFYAVMDAESFAAGIRALHPAVLDGSRDKFFWFLCGWSGGPDHYIERYGHPRLRARHLPFAIATPERDQWLACMQQALARQSWPDAVKEKLLESFFGTADWMRNQPG
ncbi:group II truncated hemoglobin [Nevskia sp.]|uniref:group II truncated hemoglobin n=1 Tax=Nevskia sp. TaxID=1929292 RepID=UPI0025D78173|nr:group II truncated hemoglobin [Nevskia sp.]